METTPTEFELSDVGCDEDDGNDNDDVLTKQKVDFLEYDNNDA